MQIHRQKKGKIGCFLRTEYIAAQQTDTKKISDRIVVIHINMRDFSAPNNAIVSIPVAADATNKKTFFINEIEKILISYVP